MVRPFCSAVHWACRPQTPFLMRAYRGSSRYLQRNSWLSTLARVSFHRPPGGGEDGEVGGDHSSTTCPRGADATRSGPGQADPPGQGHHFQALLGTLTDYHQQHQRVRRGISRPAADESESWCGGTECLGRETQSGPFLTEHLPEPRKGFRLMTSRKRDPSTPLPRVHLRPTDTGDTSLLSRNLRGARQEIEKWGPTAHAQVHHLNGLPVIFGLALCSPAVRLIEYVFSPTVSET